MQTFIQNFINNWDICKTVKYDRRPLKLNYNITPTPSKPFDIIHIDVLKYEQHKMLTIIDSFTKYAQAYILENMTAIEISDKLLTFFSHHSVPNLVIADNGPEFNNTLISNLFKLHKIELHLCSPHHPQSNGLIERFHATILEHLNLINNRTEFKSDKFKSKLLYALIAYNNSTHSSTKLSPFEILNYDKNSMNDLNLESEIINSYVQNHKEKVEILNRKINEILITNKERVINKANETREDVSELPDTVFVKGNFRSKKRNKFKREIVKAVDKQMKTFTPEINPSKTKYTKLNIDNVKRPTKQTYY